MTRRTIDELMPTRCDQCGEVIDVDENTHSHDAESDQYICETCCAKTEAYWRAEYNALRQYEPTPEQYRQEMIEAGRGHLLPPEK